MENKSSKAEMLAMLEEEKEIRKERIIAEKDGDVFVNFHDASVLNSADAYENETGLRSYNPDGSIASTGKRVHAMNPDFYFANRYKVKAKKLYVVSGHTPEGFRVIQEQSTGRCFIKSIPCAVIARDAETKELFLEKVTMISDSDFISDFTNTLDNKTMAEILPLIVDHGADMTADTMPI